MPVADWFWAFVDRHVERIPRSDWPPLESEYWGTVWVGAIVRHGVVEVVADDASVSLAMSPPKFLANQLSAFIESVKTAWALSEVTDTSQNYASIQAANRGCLYCYGGGIVSRKVTFQSGRIGGCSFYCVCPAGRWLKIEHAKSSGDSSTKGRIPDLADYPQLKEPPIESAVAIEHPSQLRSDTLTRLYGPIVRSLPTPRRSARWEPSQNPRPIEIHDLSDAPF